MCRIVLVLLLVTIGSQANAQGVCGLTNCVGVPDFTPSFWNRPTSSSVTPQHSRQYKNNCYNYGTNTPNPPGWPPGSSHGAQPGRGVDMSNDYKRTTCSEVTRAALDDGLISAGPIDDCRTFDCGGLSLVALVVSRKLPDYHWYRQDRNGNWSHKRGMMPAKNVDESNNPITDPRTADRVSYTDFCGYFLTNSSQQEGQGSANIR